MISDTLIRDIFDLVKSWLDSIVDALATEKEHFDLRTVVAPERDDTYSDPRHSSMAESSMKTMPLPLQTLLTALTELKQDIVRDKCLQRSNYESTLESILDASITSVLKALHLCKTEKADAITLGLSNNIDHALEARIHSIVGPVEPSQWVPKLLEALKDESLKVSNVTLTESAREPLIRPLKQYASCDRALKAVEDSKTTRARLEALAQGPLSSLFEHPLKIETNKGLEETTQGQQVKPYAHESTSARKETILSLLRQAERMRRSILQMQHTLIDQAINQAESTIRMAKRTLVIGAFEYATPEDMKIADSKIQTEIKYIIQTITTDRSNLDQVLRNIRSSCDAIEKENTAESTAHWIILTAKWRLQLMGAY